MILNFNVYEKTLAELDINTVRVINTINPHSYCITKKDDEFKKALNSSDLLLPDGTGIVLAARLLNNKKITKIAGYDIFEYLMNDLENKKGSCFFLGASQSTLDLIKKRAAKDYPNVKVNSFSPPYKSAFNASDNETMCAKVNAHQPQVVFIGMTAPKQEKWVFNNQDNLDANVICSIGAVFDFYAGTVKRPSKFWIKLGLEWFPRFINEPKRLAERNLVSTPLFLWEIFQKKLNSSFVK